MRKSLFAIVLLYSLSAYGIDKTVPVWQRDGQYKIHENIKGEIPECNPNQSLIVFLRTQSGVKSFRVYEDETLIGVLRDATYFCHFAKPGIHRFGAYSEGGYGESEFDLKPGEILYIHVFKRGAVMRLEIMDQQNQAKRIKKWLKKCRLIQIKHSARTWDKDNYEQIKAARNKFYKDNLPE